jgi:uncharacterized protein YjbI with pentapeptide repeats
MLRQTDFSGADLSRANLQKAWLQDSNLSRADLRGADLSKMCSWSDSNFDDAIYDRSTKFPIRFNPSKRGMILVG